MSDLQLWLAGAGILIVGGVVVFNKFQEARVRRRAEHAFGEQPADVLLGEGPAGPVAAVGGAPVELEPDDQAIATSRPAAPKEQGHVIVDRIEHQLGLPHAPDLPAGAGPVHDPRVDGIAVIMLSAPQSGEAILRHADGLLVDVDKAVRWEGLDDAKKMWTKLSPKATYPAVRAGIQLVDRRGRVTEEDLNRAFARLQELAGTLEGELHLPCRSETLRIAERLDVFCSEVDVQIGLNIVKRDGSAFSGTRIRQVVEASGCILDAHGRFRRAAPQGAESYTVANLEPTLFAVDTLAGLSTHAITAVMDVPRVPSGITSFEAFRDFAFQLAQVLDGQVVDDNRQPILASALEAIGLEVEGIRTRMRGAGIEPGGPIALRVFA